MKMLQLNPSHHQVIQPKANPSISKESSQILHLLSPSKLPHDLIQFEGTSKLLEKYGINLESVQVQAEPGISISPEEKKRLVIQALKTYEHAQKKRILNEFRLTTTPDVKNISGRNFSSTIELANGLTETAVNSEFTRDDILCGERSGIVAAINKAISKLNINKLSSDPEYVKQAQTGIHVKRIIMSGAHRTSGSNPMDATKDSVGSPPPCSDCQAWMATDEYFDKTTQIVSLDRKPDQSFVLKIMTVGTMLPLWGDASLSKSNQSIDTMPLKTSPRAQTLLSSGAPNTLDEERIRELVKAAKSSYETNQLAEVSKKNGAVSALFMPINKIYTQPRFDITARWYNDPAKGVLETGFREMEKQGVSTNPTDGASAVAFAFYGDYPQPTVNTLGYLSQLERGEGADKSLIIRIEKDTIQVRTIRDMLPEVYMSARVPREGKPTV
ncbi:MAG: hypothetical protein K2X66_06070 [Cyanobacteria bacterium]|nr:hypothetical protein [Cyanobacteriota bacterium]